MVIFLNAFLTLIAALAVFYGVAVLHGSVVRTSLKANVPAANGFWLGIIVAYLVWYFGFLHR